MSREGQPLSVWYFREPGSFLCFLFSPISAVFECSRPLYRAPGCWPSLSAGGLERPKIKAVHGVKLLRRGAGLSGHDPLSIYSTHSVIKVAADSRIMPTIDVSDYVKEELERIKKEEQHRSFDSVVRALLGNYEQ